MVLSKETSALNESAPIIEISQNYRELLAQDQTLKAFHKKMQKFLRNKMKNVEESLKKVRFSIYYAPDGDEQPPMMELLVPPELENNFTDIINAVEDNFKDYLMQEANDFQEYKQDREVQRRYRMIVRWETSDAD
ncbi:MAG TPA: hypothetical protein VKK79_21405 [Candidatus Lokiarchaeia archaeon]|nr:hypothetical protein [Candidatus Lokiarchaeia archaeon]